MNARSFKVPLFVAAGLLLIFGQAVAGERTVNCDKGDSLQKAIDAGAGSANNVVIFAIGTCTENVLITRDRVTINGDGNTVIDGRISVRGADNLVVTDLTITGPGTGISASVARVRLINVHLVGNDGYGMALRHGGYVFMRDGSIANNQGDIGLLIENGSGQLRDVEVSGNYLDGIVVNVNGSLTMIGGSVNSHEQGNGIAADLNSSVELEGVHVTNNLAGISVSSGSSARIEDSTINENADAGVSVADSGTLGLNNVGIFGNHSGISASMAKITLQNSQVFGNAEFGIEMSDNSVLRAFDSGVTANGFIGISINRVSSLVAERVDISWNGSSGVAVSFNSNASIDACTIGNNAQIIRFRSGVFVNTSSSAAINSTEIFGNLTGVGVARQSFVNLTGGTVVRDNFRDGMRLSYDSGAIVNDPVIIPPNGSGWAVFCTDSESSFEDRSGGVDPINCKGFDLP